MSRLFCIFTTDKDKKNYYICYSETFDLDEEDKDSISQRPDEPDVETAVRLALWLGQLRYMVCKTCVAL